jgi:hypothetical protein
VQGDNDKVSGRSRRCDERQELCCRNGTHSPIFGLEFALNKAKSNAVIPSEVEESRGNTRNIPRDPSTPLLYAQDDGRRVPIFTISRNSDPANDITDKRDWRTNAIPFSRG